MNHDPRNDFLTPNEQEIDAAHREFKTAQLEALRRELDKALSQKPADRQGDPERIDTNLLDPKDVKDQERLKGVEAWCKDYRLAQEQLAAEAALSEKERARIAAERTKEYERQERAFRKKHQREENPPRISRRTAVAGATLLGIAGLTGIHVAKKKGYAFDDEDKNTGIDARGRSNNINWEEKGARGHADAKNFNADKARAFAQTIKRYAAEHADAGDAPLKAIGATFGDAHHYRRYAEIKSLREPDKDQMLARMAIAEGQGFNVTQTGTMAIEKGRVILLQPESGIQIIAHDNKIRLEKPGAPRDKSMAVSFNTYPDDTIIVMPNPAQKAELQLNIADTSFEKLFVLADKGMLTYNSYRDIGHIKNGKYRHPDPKRDEPDRLIDTHIHMVPTSTPGTIAIHTPQTQSPNISELWKPDPASTGRYQLLLNSYQLGDSLRGMKDVNSIDQDIGPQQIATIKLREPRVLAAVGTPKYGDLPQAAIRLEKKAVYDAQALEVDLKKLVRNVHLQENLYQITDAIDSLSLRFLVPNEMPLQTLNPGPKSREQAALRALEYKVEGRAMHDKMQARSAAMEQTISVRAYLRRTKHGDKQAPRIERLSIDIAQEAPPLQIQFENNTLRFINSKEGKEVGTVHVRADAVDALTFNRRTNIDRTTEDIQRSEKKTRFLPIDASFKNVELDNNDLHATIDCSRLRSAVKDCRYQWSSGYNEPTMHVTVLPSHYDKMHVIGNQCCIATSEPGKEGAISIVHDGSVYAKKSELQLYTRDGDAEEMLMAFIDGRLQQEVAERFRKYTKQELSAISPTAKILERQISESARRR